MGTWEVQQAGLSAMWGFWTLNEALVAQLGSRSDFPHDTEMWKEHRTLQGMLLNLSELPVSAYETNTMLFWARNEEYMENLTPFLPSFLSSKNVKFLLLAYFSLLL